MATGYFFARNPMQANDKDLVGVGVRISPKGTDGVQLMLDVASTAASQVINEQEDTDFLNLENLPQDPMARNAIYGRVLAELDAENGKHYILINPVYASELIAYINKKRPDYTETIARNANLLYANIKKGSEIKGLPEDECKIQVLKRIAGEEDTKHAAAIAKFQKERLLEMRPSLPDAAALKKMDERYSEKALLDKARSGRIIVLSAVKNNGEIAATFVVNPHATESKSIAHESVYVSDIIIQKELVGNESFVIPFLVSAIQQLRMELPTVKIPTFMAPGPSTDPLVICIKKAVDVGLFSKLDTNKQAELGLIPYFTQSPANKPIRNKEDTPACSLHHRQDVPAIPRVTIP